MGHAMPICIWQRWLFVDRLLLNEMNTIASSDDYVVRNVEYFVVFHIWIHLFNICKLIDEIWHRKRINILFVLFPWRKILISSCYRVFVWSVNIRKCIIYLHNNSWCKWGYVIHVLRNGIVSVGFLSSLSLRLLFISL